ncbi:MAG: 5'(3')-deoxyribonucleotidase [Prevotella sp.]|jgi:5'(3')-deoxyribonucleotidase|nr:5'(3')-deoxyribonucleotidase [Prevotella sp.]
MKQVLVDMDGVLADVYRQFQLYEERETGKQINLEQLVGILELDAFPNGKKHVTSEGFFRTAPVIDGSIEGLKYLNEKYNVLIVSSATEFPQSLTEKVDWLHEHFPFISWKQIILCGEKKSIRGDIMIDDHPKNLDFFEGKKIIFSQPHNGLLKSDQYKRVNSWQDVMSVL